MAALRCSSTPHRHPFSSEPEPSHPHNRQNRSTLPQALPRKRPTPASLRSQHFLVRGESSGNELRPSVSTRDATAQASVSGIGLQQGYPNPAAAALQQSQQRREASLEEYSKLKAELMRLTANVTVLGSAYCFLSFGLETTLSYGFGCIFSVAYLQELFKSADAASRANVPKVFQGRLPRKRTTSFFTTVSYVSKGERLREGVKVALTSQRLLLPGLMMLSFAASRAATEGDMSQLHLELVPMLFGFVTYKAAVLYITLKEQADLLV